MMMNYNKLFLVTAACVTTAIAPVAANAQTSPADRTTTTQTTEDRTDHKDYGWIGLLGLLGLAGLMKKRHDDHRHDTTAARSDVRR